MSSNTAFSDLGNTDNVAMPEAGINLNITDDFIAEWENLPMATFAAGKEYADAGYRLEELKRKYDLHLADSDRVIRNSPAEYGIPKMTEAALQSVITSLPLTQEYQSQINEAKCRKELAYALVTAMGCKKSALEALMEIKGVQNYTER